MTDTNNAPTPEDWSEFIPENPYEGSGMGGRLDGAVEALKDKVGIVQGYRDWIGKMDPVERGVESIMCSCPRPDHEDKNPSAWMNSDKNVWYCMACDQGGDVIDFAAIQFGFDIDTYKTESFSEVLKLALIYTGLDPDDFQAVDDIESEPLPEVNEKDPVVVEEVPDEGEVIPSLDTPPTIDFDWEALVPPNTFIDHWMRATSQTELPDTFLFFLAMQMIGLACGPDVRLVGGSFAVVPNLSICLLGATGDGKSLSTKIARKLVRETLKFDETDSYNKGVKLIGRPGSGESLYEQFSWMPAGEYQPVRGWVEIPELNELMSVGGRKGNTLKDSVIRVIDGEHIQHSVRSASAFEAKDPFCCMVAGAQPEALRNILTQQDVVGGLTNRFAYVRGVKKPMKPWGATKPLDTDGLDMELTNVHKYASASRNVSIAPDAVDVWDAQRTRLEIKSNEHPVLARIGLIAARLTAIWAVAHKTDIVTKEMIAQIDVMVDFLIPGADVVYLQVDATDDSDLWNKIIETVEWYPGKNERNPSIGDIKNSFSSTKRRKQGPQISRMIAEMIQKNVISPVNPTREEVQAGRRGSKPVVRYEVTK